MTHDVPHDGPAWRVGLTGGIASGKSTVAAMFEAHGVPVIDTDLIAREVVAPGTPALDAIIRTFGRDLRQDDGSLDRRRLRERVFADEAARRQLEALLHPLIMARCEALSAAAGGAYQVLVVPLLVETGYASRVDRVLVVDCPEAVQRMRLATRDGETAQGIERLLAAQLPRAERLAAADDIIDNSGSRADTAQQVARLHARYLLLSHTTGG